MKCPFCSAELERDAVACPGCHARRGVHMFGALPDRPLIAWTKGFILPAATVAVCAGGNAVEPSPAWFLAAGFALMVAALAMPRLLHGSRWFHY